MSKNNHMKEMLDIKSIFFFGFNFARIFQNAGWILKPTSIEEM